MLSPLTILFAIAAYLLLLFSIAFFVERNKRFCRTVADSPVIYSLSLAVYCTTWTFYGSVGRAATSGLDMLAIYIGPTLAFLAALQIIRKQVVIKDRFKTTSIADFISARYSRPHLLSALVTLVCMVGIMPYIALQLKAVVQSMWVLSPSMGPHELWIGKNLGLIIALAMIGFTVLFGVRRLDPTERHPGMITAVALDAVVKLTAFLCCGIFIIFVANDGFNDVLRKALATDPSAMKLLSFKDDGADGYLTWGTLLILAMSAILFLPRQFHMTVVENSNPAHIRTAMWLFPLYLLVINIFVMPLALAGIGAGIPVARSDVYMLSLPLHYENPMLALFVFIGGFSAASAMVMISAMTMATMIVNHLVLPMASRVGLLHAAGRRLLQLRWAAVALVILLGHWFQSEVGESYALVNMGLISFAAVLQFAPSVLGALFWKRANFAGALGGLLAGFTVWFYTLLLPAFIKSGWIGPSLLENGPLGLGFLRPEALFGLEGLPPLVHCVFWSVFLNTSLFAILSLAVDRTDREQQVAEEFVDALTGNPLDQPASHVEVDLQEKSLKLMGSLQRQLAPGKASALLAECAAKRGMAQSKTVDVVEYARFFREVERALSGLFGYAMAKQVLNRDYFFTDEEQRALSEGYGRILARLNLPPRKLLERIDYHEERERLLEEHGRELARKVRERDQELRIRMAAEAALKTSEEKYHSIFDNAVEGIFQSTREGRFIAVNPAMAHMMGYDSPQHMINSITDIARDLYVDAGQRKRLFELIDEKGNIKGFQVEVKRADWSKRWLELSLRPIYDKKGNLQYIEGIAMDITRRIMAEQGLKRYHEHLEDLVSERENELQDSDRLLKDIMEGMNVAVVIMDTEKHTIVMANEAAGTLLGTEKANIVGLPCEAIPGLSPDGAACIIDPARVGEGRVRSAIISSKGREISVSRSIIATRHRGRDALVLMLMEIQDN